MGKSVGVGVGVIKVISGQEAKLATPIENMFRMFCSGLGPVQSIQLRNAHSLLASSEVPSTDIFC